MKELTKEEKIDFCKHYLDLGIAKQDRFICNEFERYLISKKEIRFLTEENFMILFPELYNMIIETGKTLFKAFSSIYNYGDAWVCLTIDNEWQFRRDKIQELKNQLENEN